jgi:deoxyribodipyrimidine photo-lyase
VTVAVALFTRDLRVHDNPVLHARLREQGAALVLRRGDVVAEVVRLADEVDAAEVHIAADVSGYAQARQPLSEALSQRRLVTHDSVTVVAPGSSTPSGKDHFAVFTPYLRHWEKQPPRTPLPPPRALTLPSRIRHGKVLHHTDICAGITSPDLPPGGETPARRLMQAWLDEGVQRCSELHDDLAADGASRLSPYLHFGCLSATRSWPPARTPRTRTTALGTTVGGRISMHSTHGGRAVRAIPLSMPACASCSGRVTCTIGRD